MRGRRHSLSGGTGSGGGMAPLGRPRRRSATMRPLPAPLPGRGPRPGIALAAIPRPPMAAGLLASIQQVHRARTRVAHLGTPGQGIDRATAAVNATRAVTGKINGNVDGVLDVGIQDAVIRQNLRLRNNGGYNIATLSVAGHHGVSMGVNHQTGDAHATAEFLNRGGAAINRLAATNVGTTLLQGMDDSARAMAGQLRGAAVMTMMKKGNGVGTSMTPVRVANNRGGSFLRWDMNQRADDGLNQLQSDSVLLGHEMVHAWRRARGDNWFTNPPLHSTETDRKREEELETTGVVPSPTPVNENMLRGAMGIRARFDYSGLSPEPSHQQRYTRAREGIRQLERGRVLG